MLRDKSHGSVDGRSLDVGRSWRRNSHEDGGSNLDQAVEFSPYFLRSVNSGDVLYPWLFVSVACISLLGKTCLLVNNSWSCATVLRDGVHIARS